VLGTVNTERIMHSLKRNGKNCNKRQEVFVHKLLTHLAN